MSDSLLSVAARAQEKKNYTVSLEGCFCNDIHDSECVLMIFMAVMFPNDIRLSSSSVEPVQNGHSGRR